MPPKTDFCRLRECVRDEIASSLHDGGGRAREIARSVCAKHRDLISMLGDLNGLTFATKIGVDRDRRDPNAEPRNVIAAAITSAHKEYAALMGTGVAPAVTPGAPATPPWAGAATPAPAPSADASKPFWAR